MDDWWFYLPVHSKASFNSHNPMNSFFFPSCSLDKGLASFLHDAGLCCKEDYELVKVGSSTILM